jgi:hypothetical protein
MLLILLANIRQGLKELPGTNTLAYYSLIFLHYGRKKFYKIGSRVPGISRRSSRYDFSMAAPSTAAPGNTAFNSNSSVTRFMPTVGSNGNFRPNNGTNSIKCVAIVSHDNSGGNNDNGGGNSNAVAVVAQETTRRAETPVDNNVAAPATKDLNIMTNNGLLVKDSSEEEDSDQVEIFKTFFFFQQ